MLIRPETPSDFTAIHALISAAFQTAPHAAGDEPEFVGRMRASRDYLPQLAMVLERRRMLIGYLMLTRQALETTSGQFPLLHLAVVAIQPDWQGRGLGSALVRHSLLQAAALGHSAVSVVGDPDWYSRFGFASARKHSILNANGFEDEVVMLRELWPGTLMGRQGTVTLPE
jgi:predicted N-acetyltransferase YhbS